MSYVEMFRQSEILCNRSEIIVMDCQTWLQTIVRNKKNAFTTIMAI